MSTSVQRESQLLEEGILAYLQDLKILATTVQGFYGTTVLECYALGSTTLLKNKIFEGELYLRL